MTCHVSHNIGVVAKAEDGGLVKIRCLLLLGFVFHSFDSNRLYEKKKGREKYIESVKAKDKQIGDEKEDNKREGNKMQGSKAYLFLVFC